MATKKKRQLFRPPQKVVKDAKPKEVEPKPMDVPPAEHICTCCGHVYKRQNGYFIKSKSVLYKGNGGYTSICKTCLRDLYEQYCEFFDGDEEVAAERICQIIDLDFDETVWDRARKKAQGAGKERRMNRITSYVSQLNLAGKQVGETYSDTIIRRWSAKVENAETVQEAVDNEDIDTSMDVLRRFGTGFSDGDYDALQYEYQNWIDRYGEPIDKRQEELYVSICYMKLNLQKLLQKGDANIGTVAANYRSQIEAATTEIEDRKKKAEAEKKLSPIGEMIRDIEEYCPAEYYKDKKLYVDFDSLKEYIERFMMRPLKNLLTGSKELDKEFSLSDSEE